MEGNKSGTGPRVRSKEPRQEIEVRSPPKEEPACVGLTELFYGPFGNGPGGAFSFKKGSYKYKFKTRARSEGWKERWEREDKCRQICSTCPLKTPCLEFALITEEEWGVWGGWTEAERREFRAWCKAWGYEDLPFFPDLQWWIAAFELDVYGSRSFLARDWASSGKSGTNNGHQENKKSKVASNGEVRRQQAKPKRQAAKR